MVLIDIRVDEQNPEARKAARSARFGEEAPNYDPSCDAVLQKFEQDADGADSAEEVSEVVDRPRPPPVQCRRMPSGHKDSDARGLSSHDGRALSEPVANGSRTVDLTKRRPPRDGVIEVSASKARKVEIVRYGYGASSTGGQLHRPVAPQKGQAAPEMTPEPEASPPPAGGASSGHRVVLRSRSRSPPGQERQVPVDQLKQKLQRLRATAEALKGSRRGDEVSVCEPHNQTGGSRGNATPPGNFSAGTVAAPDSERPKSERQENFHKSASRVRAPGGSEALPVLGAHAVQLAAGQPHIPARPPPPRQEQPLPARGPSAAMAPPPAGWPGYPAHAVYPTRSPAPMPQPMHPGPPRLYSPVALSYGVGYLPYVAAVPGYAAGIAYHHSQTAESSSGSASLSRSNSPATRKRRAKETLAGKAKKKKRGRPGRSRLKKKPTPDPESTLEEQGLWVGGIPGPIGISQEKLGWTVALNDEHRRTFVSYRKGAFSDSALAVWWKVLSEQIPWRRPPPPASKLQLEDGAEEERRESRSFPRSACWLTQPGCKCTYEYSGTRWDPRPMPTWFDEITDWVCKTCNLKERPNCCNANYYEHGREAVGWHADDEPLFASTQRDVLIVSLSLGETRSFELHPMDAPEQVTSLLLESGDLCTMEGLCQKHYRHRVPPDLKHTGPRINLTWRWILCHQPDCPAAA
mmetsp:Transcript_18243/g.42496  ORF Transcript_18243/g.42496 Transcript_18243/m.42496 type:complete len:690 (+) Transcript_18243:77-2146(+)